MGTYRAHPGVDAYTAGLPAWQRELRQHLRDLAHAADPEVEETVERTVKPNFVRQGDVCALLSTMEDLSSTSSGLSSPTTASGGWQRIQAKG